MRWDCRKSVARCTQHFCWCTQQKYKMPKLSLSAFFLKMPNFFSEQLLTPFSKSFLLVFHFFLRHCLWFVGVARLSAAVKVKFPAWSVAVVGGGKQGMQMAFVRRRRTDGFWIKLIRKLFTDQTSCASWDSPLWCWWNTNGNAIVFSETKSPWVFRKSYKIWNNWTQNQQGRDEGVHWV